MGFFAQDMLFSDTSKFLFFAWMAGGEKGAGAGGSGKSAALVCVSFALSVSGSTTSSSLYNLIWLSANGK